MRADGVLLDVDGTLLDADDEALPGAVDAVRRLAGAGIPIRLLTNTTRRPRAEVARRLRAAGFDLGDDALFTAPVAAALWLAARNVRRISLFVADETRADFRGFTITEEEPEAVVIGDLGAGWDAEVLNRAFLPVLAGARLVALQKNRWWHSTLGPALDAGAYVAALEYAAGAEATVLGKPSADFFLLAAKSLGVEPARIVVVGDDVDTDCAGAAAAGMHAVLVRTGKYRADTLARARSRPEAVIGSIADLPEWLDETT